MVEETLPWVLSQQGSHQHATRGNGATSYLVGTSNKSIFKTKNQLIKGEKRK